MSDLRGPSTVTLSPQERLICQLLDATCRWIQQARPSLPAELGPDRAVPHLSAQEWKCEARIAGGWVRDKLLDLHSEDMDICVSCLTGFQFAHYVHLYLSTPDFAELRDQLMRQENFDESELDWKMGTITKIQANPEQGKNLQTATAQLLRRSLDFVHLRHPPLSLSPIQSSQTSDSLASEVSQKQEAQEVHQRQQDQQRTRQNAQLLSSQIPFGTPRQDAERRDLTINALFYNVHTGRVEDETGMGLCDLQNKVIRTPLSPLETWADDPLRILRSVRFASKFGFSLHADQIDCLQSSQGTQVKDALASSIRRERFGIEVDKIMRGPRPVLALENLHRLGLWSILFLPPPEADGSPVVLLKADNPETSTEPHSQHPSASGVASFPETLEQDCLSRIRSMETWWLHPDSKFDSMPHAWTRVVQDSEQRRRLYYALVLLPLHGMRAWTHPLPTGKPSGNVPKRSLAPAEGVVLIDGLRLGANATKVPVEALFHSLDALRQFQKWERNHADSFPQSDGLNLRTIQTHLYMLLRQPCFSRSPLGTNAASAFCLAYLVTSSSHEGSESDLSITDLTRWWNWVESNGWLGRLEERPVLNGKQLQALVGFAPGPLIPKIQQRVLEWQLWALTAAQIRDGGSELVTVAQNWFRQAWEEGKVLPLEEVKSARSAALDKSARPSKRMRT